MARIRSSSTLTSLLALAVAAGFLAVAAPAAHSATPPDDTPVLLTPKGEHETGADEATFDKLRDAYYWSRLLSGDQPFVCQDRKWVSFMWSYPNLIPLDEATVQDIARRLERFAFDRIYGGWWGRIVVADGPAAIRRSADRYVARLHGERP